MLKINKDMSVIDELFGRFREQPTVKTVGDPLPNSVMLKKGAAQDEIFRALSINTFLLAVKTSEANGAMVVYNAARKTATIYHTNGGNSQIKHD